MNEATTIQIPTLPKGWVLAHIIYLDPCWQVALKDSEHFAIATGDTIEEACEWATLKANRGNFLGRLYQPQDFSDPPPNLQTVLEGMGVLRKRSPAPWIDLP